MSSINESLITTVITTYRRPNLLRRAIKSVLNQTYPHFQIAVYDNCSDDETETIVTELAKKYPQIKYYRHSQNIGMLANYQFALDRVSTPFFHLLSDDDYLLPHFFETAIKDLFNYPQAAFCACNIVQLDANGNFLAKPLSLWTNQTFYPAQIGLLEMIKERFMFPIPTGVLFRTEILKTTPPELTEEIQLYWDPNFLLSIAAKFPFVINQKECGVYLCHSGSYASEIYSSLFQSGSVAEKYFKATSKVLNNLKGNKNLSPDNKKTAISLFKKYIRNDVAVFIKRFIQTEKYGCAHFLSKKFYQYFGFSFSVFLPHFFSIFLYSIRYPYITGKRLIQLLIKERKVITYPFDHNAIKCHHLYGEKLLSKDECVKKDDSETSNECSITTVIPTFQRASYLKKAVLSVLSQSYPNFQLIVCDNHSTDETEEIMKELVSLDSRVKYYRHDQNIGMMKNYEFGFSKITTPFFSFLSDDDTFAPDFYETALKDFQMYPDAAFSVCQVSAVNAKKEVIMQSLCLWNKKGYFKSPDGFLEMISPSLKTPIPTCTLFNRKVIGNIVPEFSDEIQHVWDHNYFLQLSASFSYIINGKICGFFLAHEESFTSGFFERLKNSPDELDHYIGCFCKLISNIMKHPFLSKNEKSTAVSLLKKSYTGLVHHYSGISLTDHDLSEKLGAFNEV